MDRFFSELDRYLFGVGRHYQIYEKMGAHPCTYEGKRESILRFGHPMQRQFPWYVIEMAGIRKEMP